MFTQYTFAFLKEDESRFFRVLSRFNDDEYEIISAVSDIPNAKYGAANRQITINTDADFAITFRVSMPQTLVITQARTEEEAAEIKAKRDNHIIKINISTGPSAKNSVDET